MVRNDVGTLIEHKPESATTTEIELFKKPGALKPKPKTRALDEDVYLSGIEQIIRRDFFPETAKLEAQHAYLTAMENNDVDALHAIYERYQTPRATAAAADATPHSGGAAAAAAFETPSVAGTPRHHGGGFETPMSEAGSATPRPEGERDERSAGGGVGGRGGSRAAGVAGPAVISSNDLVDDPEAFGKSIAAKKEMSLDKYLHMYTSEDNRSFEELMEVDAKKRREKNAWLYRKQDKQKVQLALTDANAQRKLKDAEHGMHMPIEGWHYTPKNALMYPPEAIESNASEMIDAAPGKVRTISKGNTRFAANPYPTTGRASRAGSTAGGEGAAAAAGGAAGASGADGGDSPKVNGYGFVVTPSPAPGVDHDPVMTWGLIEGTPFRLDASDAVARTPSSGPMFAIPAPTNRDIMQEKIFKEMNRKKRAMSASARGGTPAGQRKAKRSKTPLTMTPAARLATMSPAAQRLGKSMARGASVLLRNAYSSPFAAGRVGSSRVGSASRTPGTGRTPMSFRTRTPKATPRSARSNSGTPRQKSTLLPPGVNVTDNLL